MTRLMFDSWAQPTQAQIDAAKAIGVVCWAQYVASYDPDMVTSPETIRLILDSGMYFLGIVAPDYALDFPDAKKLVIEAMEIYKQVPCYGALAIDIERQESGSSHLLPTINGFARQCRMRFTRPVLYNGAALAYSVIDHYWDPRWSANSGILGPEPDPGPESGDAIQFAGDVEFEGALVDYSVIGSAFPMCLKGTTADGPTP